MTVPTPTLSPACHQRSRSASTSRTADLLRARPLGRVVPIAPRQPARSARRDHSTMTHSPQTVRRGYCGLMTAVALGIPRVGAVGAGAASLTVGRRRRTDSPCLLDTFGRRARDLRVSLTDRCNLRCTYCMPAEGLDWLPGDELLTDDELVRVIDVAVRHLGIEEIRFTGGEPLLRKGIVELIEPGRAALAAPGDVADHQRHRLRPARRRLRRGRPRPDQHLAGFARPGHLPDADPAAPADRRARCARRGGRRRAGPGQDQHRADARRQRPRGSRTCCSSAWSTATSCGSSSRCRWTPGIRGPGNGW